jgi:hypothetical protein
MFRRFIRCRGKHFPKIAPGCIGMTSFSASFCGYDEMTFGTNRFILKDEKGMIMGKRIHGG